MNICLLFLKNLFQIADTKGSWLTLILSQISYSCNKSENMFVKLKAQQKPSTFLVFVYRQFGVASL